MSGGYTVAYMDIKANVEGFEKGLEYLTWNMLGSLNKVVNTLH